MISYSPKQDRDLNSNYELFLPCVSQQEKKRSSIGHLLCVMLYTYVSPIILDNFGV